MGRIFDALDSLNKKVGDTCEVIGKGAGTMGADTAIKMMNKYGNDSPKSNNKDKVNKMDKSIDIKAINKRLDKSDSKGEFGATIDNTNHLILSRNDTELLDLDLSKESKESIEKKITKVLNENGIKKFEELDETKNYSSSDILNVITSKFVRNFSVKKVYDSTFGVCFEDEYGSLFQTNPEEDPNANCLWESKTGKRINTDEDPNESDENQESTEGNEEGLGDDLDIDLEEGSEGNTEGNVEEGSEESLDDNVDEGFDENELDNSDEDFGDESFEESSQDTSTILATSLDKAVNNLTKINNKLLKIIENGV